LSFTQSGQPRPLGILTSEMALHEEFG